MESSPSSNHITEECVTDNQKCMANHLLSNCLILSPFSSIHTHFGPSTIYKQPNCSFNIPNIQSLVKAKTSQILDGLHSSIALKAGECITFFNLFAQHNPLFSKMSSLSTDFKNFCQITRRNYIKVNSLPSHNFAAILPGDSVAGLVVANGVLNFLNIYNTLLVCRLVLTWFPNSPPFIVSPLSTLCDPYLNIFRGLIPPLGGTLDLSPILAFLVLNALTSTASALPAELPSAVVSQGMPSSPIESSDLPSSQRKWMRRLAANRSKSSSHDN